MVHLACHQTSTANTSCDGSNENHNLSFGFQFCNDFPQLRMPDTLLNAVRAKRPPLWAFVTDVSNVSTLTSANLGKKSNSLPTLLRKNCKYFFVFSSFFVGNTAKGHKSDHPMKEHCTSTGRSENLKFLGQSLRNSFRSNKYFKKQQRKLSYLPVNSVLEGEDYVSPIMSPNLSMESRDFLSAKNAKLPQRFKFQYLNTITLSPEVRFFILRFANSVDVPKSEEHDLISKYCHQLHSEEVSKNGTDGLDETHDEAELDEVFETEVSLRIIRLSLGFLQVFPSIM